jgi:hypothetical protein
MNQQAEITTSCGSTKIPEISNSDQKRNRASKLRQLKRTKEKRRTAEAARATLFSIKCNSGQQKNAYVSMSNTINNTPNNGLEIEELIHYLFSHKYPAEFSRLPYQLKLMLCQYVINSQPAETKPLPTPFVYRYSLDQHNQTQQQLNKKIQRKLSSALGRSPLFWTAPEYDDRKTRILTHSNGEILLYPNEYQTFIDAMLAVHGKNRGLDKKGKKIPDKDVTETPTTSRTTWAIKRSLFYSICNWVSYSTKPQKHMIRDNYLYKIKNVDNGYYISAGLRSAAAAAYNNNIK